MEPRKKICVSWLAGAPLIDNMGDLIGIQWMLASVRYIDQHILNKSKTGRENLALTWINYKKTSDMVSQTWILHCLKMY